MTTRTSDVPLRASLYPHVLGLATHLVVEPALGTPYLRAADFLRDFWSWPEQRRADHRRERLAAVLDSARRDVPFYRERLSASGSPEEQLQALPVVDKVVMRDDMDAFRSVRWRELPWLSKPTGGTLSGVPWQYELDRRAWVQAYAAALHFYERTGFRYGERQVLLGRAASLGHDGASLSSRLRNALERKTTAFAGPEIDPASSLQRALRACAVRSALWYGYASTIAGMADAVLAAGVAVRGPRTIITTAEPLHPEWREQIAQAFGAAVFDQYGCNDGGVLAQTCGAGRFHLADSLSLVEVLQDGRPCPPGVEGDVVVTNLHAEALPFLRYAVGDRAVLGDGRCPCGTPGATLQRVLGRSNERVVLPSGTQITGLGDFSAVFTQVPGLRRWQVVQTSPTTLTVRLDARPPFRPADAERLRRQVHRLCRGELVVLVSTEEPLTVSSGGKQLTVLRQQAGERRRSPAGAVSAGSS